MIPQNRGVFCSHCWCERAPVQGRRGTTAHTNKTKYPPAFNGFLLKGAISGLWYSFMLPVYSGAILILGDCTMYNDKKRFYTPQFSEMACVTVRRFAWALNLSMPKAVDIIISELSSAFSSSVVCPQCKDKTKCVVCGFNQQPAA